MTSTSFCVRSSTKFDLDIDQLIKEVHYRPAIWNRNCVGYTDRRLKARMWDEVCESIIDNWKKLKILQKNTLSNEIQKKWRNVKDAYKKEEKKISEGRDVGKKRQYIHFKALSFLSESERYTSNSAISLDESDVESDNTSVDQENTNATSNRKRTRNKNQDDNETLLAIKREKINFDEENSNSEHNKLTTDNNDENVLEIDIEKNDFLEENSEFVHKKTSNRDEYADRHFFEIKCDEWNNEENSPIAYKKNENKHTIKIYDEDVSFTEMMVPILRKLNDDQKHYAKIEILNILHKAKRYQASSSSQTQTEQVNAEGNREGE